MGVKLKDLSPAARAQVDAQLGTAKGRGRKLSDAGTKAPGFPLRCHDCDQEFADYDRKDGWERHAERTGHTRCDIIFDRGAAPRGTDGRP